MRLGRAICIAGLIGFGAAGMALADDVTFTASGTFDDGASLNGTLVINTGTGVVESNGLDLTVVGGGAGPLGLVVSRCATGRRSFRAIAASFRGRKHGPRPGRPESKIMTA